MSSSPISYETEVGGLEDPEVINNWHVGQEVRTGKYTVTDYNFTTPSTSLLANDPTVVNLSASQPLELFDYPGLHTTKDEGDTVAKVACRKRRHGYMVVSAAGNCRGLMSGYSFELKNHYRDDQNTHLRGHRGAAFRHSGTEYTYRGTSWRGDVLQPSDLYSGLGSLPPVRASRRSPLFRARSLHWLWAKSGEEIWVDKYGRVIVQFYWDRLGEKNENSSCWIRVSQPWAGGNWGAMWIPRIGQEVLVSFLEGDPDRPVITGRVYNADQMPPYTLPDYQTRSTFMSRSSKGGGSPTTTNFALKIWPVTNRSS